MTALALPARAKTAKLVDERGLPGHLKCSSCDKAVFNSFQSPHGCRLCQSCIDELPAQEKVPCPGKTEACRDREENTDVSQGLCFPDMASRREIGKLKVHCPNLQDGCGEQMAWREVETHLTSCDFERLQCDLCGELRLQRELAEHQKKECRQRRVLCDQCNAQVVAGLLDTEHRNLLSLSCCPKFTAPCPHCKERQLTRQQYLGHLGECREKPAACKFAHLGCTVVDSAARLGDHYREAVDKHLEMVDRRLQVGASAVASVAAAATAVVAPVPAEGLARAAADLERKALNIFGVFKRLQPNVAGWAQTTLELEDLMKAFGGAVGFKAVLKAMDDKLRQMEAAERASGGVAGASSSSTSGAAAAPTPSEMARFLDRMRTIELRFDALELTAFDGYLAWKLAGVAAKRREARSGATASLFSSPFFSRRYGYMFRLRLFLNGHEGAEGTYVSVQLVLMQGDYDDALDWPLTADVTLRLVHPRNRAEDVVSKVVLEAQKPTNAEDLSMNVSVPKFAKISVVEEKFVKNDNLYLEAEVEPRPTDSGRRGRRR